MDLSCEEEEVQISILKYVIFYFTSFMFIQIKIIIAQDINSVDLYHQGENEDTNASSTL